MENIKLDYNMLLNDWADSLFKLAEKYEDKINDSDTGSYKHGYYKGKHDGIIEAITKLNFLENRRNKKYLIND